ANSFLEEMKQGNIER
nr:factor Xa light chain, VAPam light chain=23 kda paramyxovirus-activating endoprotease light chain [chickens, amniotic fluid, Peptide Partial, 15 aa] [Gallus gallus]